jgi:Tol biopolymer transport system component
MKTKVCLLLFVGVFLLGFCSLSLAEENEVRLLVNGQEIKPDVPAQIINGRVMVPVSWITTALKADIYWDKDQRTLEINQARTLASLPDNKASLYPFKEEGGLYDGIIMELGQERKYFDWKNSTIPTYCPQLHAADIDRDGEEEIIVILTHGTGTGVHEEEVHVINPADFSEIIVENPLDIVREKVETSIYHKGEDVTVKIGLNDRTALIKMKTEDSGCWGNDVFWGNVNHFYVSDNELRADIAAQVSASGFVGEVEIYYSFDGERFTMEDIEFTAYDGWYDVSYEVPEPERVFNSSFPAQVAFINNGSLYVLDGSRQGAGPVKIDSKGQVEIVGWSPNGEWLMYLENYQRKEGRSHDYIWIVRAGGTQRQQVDAKPVTISPVWAPDSNVIAYSNCDDSEAYVPIGNLKIAEVAGETIKTTTLLPDNSGVASSIAWAPDGRSLAICRELSEDNPLLIEEVSLEGERKPLLTVDQTAKTYFTDSDIPVLHAAVLKWSPDGRYLAYYLCPMSASLAADGVSIQLLDLLQDGEVVDLGSGLAYKGWLAWSPDSRYLAYIQGGNREATVNKELWIADMETGAKISCAMEGQTDSRPFWLPETSGDILFCRGQETRAWVENAPDRLLLPEQRIWRCTPGEESRLISAGPENSADYLAAISPDGQEVLFLRLEYVKRGSLYCHQVNEDQQMELIRGISGEAGYYGNYYPDWISVYWLK